MDVGEKKTFEVTYEPDYPEEKLAGHRVRFNVVLNDIKLLDLPDLDDEFARGLGEFENLGKLKDKIREELNHQLEQNRASKLRQELVQKLIDATNFEVPELLVENRIDDKVRDLAYDMARQGLKPYQDRRGLVQHEIGSPSGCRKRDESRADIGEDRGPGGIRYLPTRGQPGARGSGQIDESADR